MQKEGEKVWYPAQRRGAPAGQLESSNGGAKTGDGKTSWIPQNGGRVHHRTRRCTGYRAVRDGETEPCTGDGGLLHDERDPLSEVLGCV